MLIVIALLYFILVVACFSTEHCDSTFWLMTVHSQDSKVGYAVDQGSDKVEVMKQIFLKDLRYFVRLQVLPKVCTLLLLNRETTITSAFEFACFIAYQVPKLGESWK